MSSILETWHRWIVANVDQLMALADALEAQLAASRATAATLSSFSERPIGL